MCAHSSCDGQSLTIRANAKQDVFEIAFTALFLLSNLLILLGLELAAIVVEMTLYIDLACVYSQMVFSLSMWTMIT